MTVEIERKFLVKGDSWRSLAAGKLYRQGYIPTQDGLTTVRVRVVGDRGYLTIKGKTEGISRLEFEYAIPLEDAAIMLENLCKKPLIEKIRWII
jgi:adenylate cyclase